MFSQVETGHFWGFYTLLQYLAYFPVFVVLLHMNYTLCINVNRIKRQKPKVWVKRGVGGGGASAPLPLVVPHVLVTPAELYWAAHRNLPPDRNMWMPTMNKAELRKFYVPVNGGFCFKLTVFWKCTQNNERHDATNKAWERHLR